MRISYFIPFALCVSMLVACDEKLSTEELSAVAVADGTAPLPSENSSKAQKSAVTTTIEFANKSVDFGLINEGEIKEHEFKFKNTGEHPLVISDATASCGCTIPEWTKDPVQPGKEGTLKVKYNSTGKQGKIHKTVSVSANTNPEVTVLDLNVEVKPRDNSQGPFADKK